MKTSVAIERWNQCFAIPGTAEIAAGNAEPADLCVPRWDYRKVDIQILEFLTFAGFGTRLRVRVDGGLGVAPMAS